MFEINFDSSIFISLLIKDIHFHKTIEAIDYLHKTNANIYISLITYSEIWTGVELMDNNIKKKQLEENIQQMLTFLNVKIVTDNITVSKRAAVAQAEYRKRRGRREFLIPDFLIGANAEFYSGKILTTNPRDFLKYFSNLEVITPKELLENNIK